MWGLWVSRHRKHRIAESNIERSWQQDSPGEQVHFSAEGRRFKGGSLLQLSKPRKPSIASTHRPLGSSFWWHIYIYIYIYIFLFRIL